MKRYFKNPPALLMCIALAVFSIQTAAQSNIVKAEYYLDTDPGFGDATNISITPGTDISAQAFSADISSLSSGIHYLHARAMDAKGNWSLNNTAIFYKGASLGGGATPALVNVVQAEYYIDNDPGFGNATSIAITPGTNISSQSFSVDLSAVPSGIHYLHCRAKDASGNWSLNNTAIFYKGGSLGGGTPPPAVNIVQAEYYLDTDPGFGKATAIAITPGTDISGQSFSVDISAVPSGIHYLHSRALDAHGNWSLNNTAIFYKGIPLGGGTPPAAGALSKLEYFFDADPGFGKGKPVTIPGNITDTAAFVFNANFGGLSIGKHAFYVRAMDDWGITTEDSFTVTVALPVTLLNFKAELVQSEVQLTWQTSSEFNNDYFEVDHSTDGVQFNAIGDVKGQGTSSILNNYNFTDEHPAEGENYYRLKQVDIDGNSTFSSIVNVKLSLGFSYLVYPNPATNEVNILISSDKDQQMIFTLTDIVGRIIASKELNCVRGSNSFQWNISSLSKGMYLLRSNDPQAPVVKIAKQ